MSDLPADIAQAPPGQDLRLEQRIFDLSPVGTLPTAIAAFAILIGSFELAARLTNYPLSAQLKLDAQEGGWPAVVLSLLLSVALGLQRYVRKKDLEDDPSLAEVLPCTAAEYAADEKAEETALRWAGLIGGLIGCAGTFFVVPLEVRIQHVPVFVWFAVAMTLLGAMFARGIVMTRAGSRSFSRRVARHLKVDLMRVDELFVIGRRAARSALVWLSVAAIICLFFVGSHTPLFIIGMIVAAAGMAIWIFFRSLEEVHRKIRQAKRAELDHVRSQIAAAKTDAHHDHTAAAKLHGLIAYEARIAAVKEWPFDQWTLVRVSAYVLIPALPALAQSGFKYFVEHF
ncbi:MAG TPA: hypothetical protein VMU22_02430 [Rhizomicrobium sp.]|nr:hypothetical protein [Rhizomicrobium sp.]